MSWTMETLKNIGYIAGGILTAAGTVWKLGGKKAWNNWYEHYKANRSVWRNHVMENMQQIKMQLYPNGGSSMRDDMTYVKHTVNHLVWGQRNQMELLDVATWESDMAGNFTFVSTSMCELFGCSPSELLISAWIGRVVPEDRDRVYKLWLQSIHHGSSFDEIIEISRCNDNKRLKVNAIAVHNKDKNGTVLNSLGRFKFPIHETMVN